MPTWFEADSWAKHGDFQAPAGQAGTKRQLSAASPQIDGKCCRGELACSVHRWISTGSTARAISYLRLCNKLVAFHDYDAVSSNAGAKIKTRRQT